MIALRPRRATRGKRGVLAHRAPLLQQLPLENVRLLGLVVEGAVEHEAERAAQPNRLLPLVRVAAPGRRRGSSRHG